LNSLNEDAMRPDRSMHAASALTGLLLATACGGYSAVTTVSPSEGMSAAEAAASVHVRAVANTDSRLARTADEVGLDPVTILDRRIESGEVTLEFDETHGWLPALMTALEVPLSSQGFVASRTSLQTDRITPWTPRALYFNDDVYLGFVQESPFLEIAAIDPDEGAVFFTVTQFDGDRPLFKKETTTCLICHESRAVTGGISGVIMRSVLPDRYGYVVTSIHEGSVTDRTPFEERLGGWYVTGTHGAPGHVGNTLTPELAHEIPDVSRYLEDFDLSANGNVTSLHDRFDVTPYMSVHSDIVALLVLGHQTRIHNLIISARETATDAMTEQEGRLRSMGRDAPESGMLEATSQRIDGAVDRLLRDMLFVREAPMPGPVLGTSGYAEEFASWGPHDTQGRSLRDFDLETRLFQYPLSFLIYSDAFDALPEVVLQRFYAGLVEVLEAVVPSEEYAHLDLPTRAAIVEILMDTKPDFAAARSR